METIPREEDIYRGLRSVIRGDYITRSALEAIRDLCLFALGEIDRPIGYYDETIPFNPEYKIPTGDDPWMLKK